MDYSKYEPEAHRLRLLVERDGLPSAVEFARTTKASYRRATLHGLSRSRDMRIATNLRRGYIESYLAFKRFEKDHSG